MDSLPRWDFEALRSLVELARSDIAQAPRLLQVVKAFVEERRGDVKKLQGRPGEWRLRSGDWRAIFMRSPDGPGIVILAIDNRRDAY
jgi:mRNA-degrading endonuclease RelE of RelBE toxin-antitoxin system